MEPKHIHTQPKTLESCKKTEQKTSKHPKETQRERKKKMSQEFYANGNKAENECVNLFEFDVSLQRATFI